MPEDRQPTTFVIGQADPAAQMCAEDAVLFSSIRYTTLACRWLARPATAITNSRTAATSTTAGVYLTR
jgi:hypothetical protein